MKLKFCSLSSGSSGNCYYLGDGSSGILIDAGISASQIRDHLKKLEVPIEAIMGIFITHDHSDHIRGLSVLVKKNHIPVYTTETVWKGILSSSAKKNITSDCIRKISVLKTVHLAGFAIEAFPVSHDTEETLGFHICAGDKQITIVTDLGYICETVAKYINAANFLVIESNYDNEMLMKGRYPAYLKARIRSNNGHLDNQQTSTFLADNVSDHLTHICLAHLSKNNNTPEKALETLHNCFAAKGRAINGKPKIVVLERGVPSDVICLEEGLI